VQIDKNMSSRLNKFLPAPLNNWGNRKFMHGPRVAKALAVAQKSQINSHPLYVTLDFSTSKSLSTQLCPVEMTISDYPIA
jgi:hypothetical protein